MPKKTDPDFTQRVLMSLAVDVHEARENIERVYVQVAAAAKANGIKMPRG